MEPGVLCCASWRCWSAERLGLDDVGHAPQLDVPLETAQLILELPSW
jgi:hypothetical protein